MPFPAFEPGRKGILFFSRGRGRGHAIPDLEIAREWERIDPKVSIHFVSYGTGAATIEAAGRPLIKLDLADQGSITDMTLYAGKLIGGLAPDLVVSHEEWAALPVAKIFDKPTAVITDYFVGPEMHSMQCLRFADRIIFTDRPGGYAEPPGTRGRVEYVGHVCRKFDYSRRDRARARRELSIPAEALFLLVLPGSWTEAMLPSFDLIASAWRKLPTPKRMTWVAGSDAPEMRARSLDEMNVVEFDPRIDRLMCAADVAITKCNRQTLMELDHFGIPSVSVWNESNPIDFARAQSLPLNHVLPKTATPAVLARALTQALTRRAPRRRSKPDAALAAARILDSIAI